MKRRLMVAAAAVLLLAGCGSATPSAAPTSQPQPTEAAATAPAPAAGASVADAPIVPEISAHAKALFQASLAAGRNAKVFAKVGNCMTASPDYLAPLTNSKYDLGQYSALQPTIDYFQSAIIREENGTKFDSFSLVSQAAGSGFTSSSPLDPIWANPTYCQSGETPLACEYRLDNPSMALILFGTNDVQYLEIDTFEGYMRTILDESIKANVVPVLITFPPLPDRMDKTQEYNQVIANLAAEYDVPLVNLWRALLDKPGYGVDPEHVTRLTTPADGCAVCFSETDLGSGITTENLVMLQSLDVLRQELAK